jgi:hypothetical protein
MPNNQILYKYRSLKDFKFFIDIIVNNRLYAAAYTELNDLMEGHYHYKAGELTKNALMRIKDSKETVRICSLSKVEDNELMWAHYADGHHGVVVGIKIDESVVTTPIIYGNLPKIEENINQQNTLLTAKEILSHKLEFWDYEQEVRVFVNSGNFVNVAVKKIILGKRMATQDIGLIKKIVKKINPDIEIINLSRTREN